MAIARPDALMALSSLRKGSAPAALARELFVGQQAWFDTALDQVREVAECRYFDVRFIRARYGGGKTHFLRCLETDAAASNFVTAYALLKHKEVELDRFNSVISEICKQMSLPDGSRGFSSLLRQFLDNVARKAGFAPDRALSLATREKARRATGDFCREHGVPYNLNIALQRAMCAFLDADDLLVDQMAHWFGGGRDTLKVDPAELVIPGQAPTKATVTRLKPLGVGDAEQLIRLLALLTLQCGYSGMVISLDEIELIEGMRGTRRANSFQTLRALVDMDDLRCLPPATSLFLAATPEMFENPEMFPSYKALQDRIDALPALGGDEQINLKAPVINLDLTELGAEELHQLADKIAKLFVAGGGTPPSQLDISLDNLIQTIVNGNYVIARPRLLCRCMLDLLEGRLGSDLRQEVARRTREMEEKREREKDGR